MEALGKVLRCVVTFLFVFAVVLGSVALSPAAAARPTVGFSPLEAAVDREAGTGALARPRETASVGRGGAGAAENGRVKVGESYYASLLLSALPRGPSPPSGPSPQINDVKA